MKVQTLEAVSAIFQFYPQYAVDSLQFGSELIDKDIQRLEEEFHQLLGVEQIRKNQILEEKSNLFKTKKKVEKMMEISSAGFHSWIPLDPLRWRADFFPKFSINWKTQDSIMREKIAADSIIQYIHLRVAMSLPVFALLDVNSTSMVFRATSQISGFDAAVCEPKLPPELDLFYRDVYDQLRKLLLHWDQNLKDCDVIIEPTGVSITGDLARKTLDIVLESFKNRRITTKIDIAQLSSDFNGTIPADTRKKIRVAQPIFDRIFLLAEVGEWQGNVEVRTLKIDPIVVGWLQLFPDYLWYIDAFDITPLENKIPIAF